jgi:hypothetical protein
LWFFRPCLHTRLTFKHNDPVRQVRRHDKIVLDDKGRLFSVQDKPFDDFCSNDTLLRIEVGGRFINEVNIGGGTKTEDQGDTLEFPTGEGLDFIVEDVFQGEGFDDIGIELWV